MRLLILAGGVLLFCVGVILSVVVAVRMRSGAKTPASEASPSVLDSSKSDWTVTTIRPRGPHQGIR